MRFALLILTVSFLLPAKAQTIRVEEHLLQLVDRFFLALEKQDTATFNGMFLPNGYFYAVREIDKDSAVVRSQLPSEYKFRPGQIIKERMRKKTTSVKIDGRIGMVWAPYDLWINESFSHCGVDVFTFMQTSGGWKIASIAYTVETECTSP